MKLVITFIISVMCAITSYSCLANTYGTISLPLSKSNTGAYYLKALNNFTSNTDLTFIAYAQDTMNAETPGGNPYSFNVGGTTLQIGPQLAQSIWPVGQTVTLEAPNPILNFISCSNDNLENYSLTCYQFRYQPLIFIYTFIIKGETTNSIFVTISNQVLSPNNTDFLRFGFWQDSTMGLSEFNTDIQNAYENNTLSNTAGYWNISTNNNVITAVYGNYKITFQFVNIGNYLLEANIQKL